MNRQVMLISIGLVPPRILFDPIAYTYKKAVFTIIIQLGIKTAVTIFKPPVGPVMYGCIAV
jgi:hypothetical protein